MLENFRIKLRHHLEGPAMQGTVAVLIIINAAVMSLEHYGQPIEITHFIEVTNLVLTCVFFFELCLKIFANGFASFIREPLNIMDLLVINIKFV